MFRPLCNFRFSGPKQLLLVCTSCIQCPSCNRSQNIVRTCTLRCTVTFNALLPTLILYFYCPIQAILVRLPLTALLCTGLLANFKMFSTTTIMSSRFQSVLTFRILDLFGRFFTKHFPIANMVERVTLRNFPAETDSRQEFVLLSTTASHRVRSTEL